MLTLASRCHICVVRLVTPRLTCCQCLMVDVNLCYSLAGITSLQTYVYYQHPYSERDSRLFRAVVSDYSLFMGPPSSNNIYGTDLLSMVRSFAIYRTRVLHGHFRILDMLHAAFVSHATYVYNVTYYGDPLELLKPCWYVSAFTGCADIIF